MSKKAIIEGNLSIDYGCVEPAIFIDELCSNSGDGDVYFIHWLETALGDARLVDYKKELGRVRITVEVVGG